MNDPRMLPQVARRAVSDALAAALAARFGDRWSCSAAVCLQHGRDESPFPPMPPDGVVFATSIDDVVDVVQACAAADVPVIPFGTGSSLEGHLLAVAGGVSLDMSRMDRVIAIDARDFTATVECGVTRKQLNAALKDLGLFFPVDPGADASLGGMAATRASGTNAVRYGTMRENVLGMTVVTADGQIVHTGRRAKKSSAGYDLTRLFVGSEGTLGVIVELTVKLYPLPEAVFAAAASFASVRDAVDCVIEIMQLGVPVARAELLDALTVRAVNAYSKTTFDERPLVLFEFHGSASSVDEQIDLVQSVVEAHGGGRFASASTPEARSQLWAARHNAYFACLQLKPGCRSFTTDVCVPISRLAEAIDAALAAIDASPLPAPVLGHIGDGNFHCAILANPQSPEELDEAERLNRKIVEAALALDGTCTGEHGVGMHKMNFLIDEHGAGAVELMRSIKHALDPRNILNPGKVVAW